MSFKLSNAYFPNIIKIYETTDQLMQENGLIEFLEDIIRVMSERSIRFEYQLDVSKTYIVSTIEFHSEDAHIESRKMMDDILATADYEIPVGFITTHHLF